MREGNGLARMVGARYLWQVAVAVFWQVVAHTPGMGRRAPG